MPSQSEFTQLAPDGSISTRWGCTWTGGRVCVQKTGLVISVLWGDDYKHEVMLTSAFETQQFFFLFNPPSQSRIRNVSTSICRIKVSLSRFLDTQHWDTAHATTLTWEQYFRVQAKMECGDFSLRFVRTTHSFNKSLKTSIMILGKKNQSVSLINKVMYVK